MALVGMSHINHSVNTSVGCCSLAGLEDVKAIAMKDAVLAQSLLPDHAIGPLPLIQAVPGEGAQIQDVGVC